MVHITPKHIHTRLQIMGNLKKTIAEEEERLASEAAVSATTNANALDETHTDRFPGAESAASRAQGLYLQDEDPQRH